MQFFESNKKWKNKADELKDIVSKTHNACHDYAMAHPYRTIPIALRADYEDAQKSLNIHKDAESKRYFESIRDI